MFMPKDGESPETFSVRLDQWISKNSHHPEERFVVLESSTSELYATTFPREVGLLHKVEFIRSDGKNRMRSAFHPSDPGSVNVTSIEYTGKDQCRFLIVGEYLLYEQEESGRWVLIEYDSKKLPR